MSTQADLLDLAAPTERAGFRLHRLEFLNWGTFHEKAWHLDLGGDTSLLTGDIGSGKSTVVDALTTLLIEPRRVSYNKAAGAEARERTPTSYVLGHYKSERNEGGERAKPVALRDASSWSVLLGHFFNEGYQQHVTLAQVFWMKDADGPPARLCIVADQALSITKHFTDFADVTELRRRLKGLKAELFDSFTAYQGAFRRRFGLQNDQALDLFNQTVSMKSVGNLTDFVRQHMLQPFPVEERVKSLIAHVDDLTRAHEAVLKAREQVRALEPLVADCDAHAALDARMQVDRACRDAVEPAFLEERLNLWGLQLERVARETATLEVDLVAHGARRDTLQGERDGLLQDHARNGGDRLERLKHDEAALEKERQERQASAQQYDDAAKQAGLPVSSDALAFADNEKQARAALEEATKGLGALRTRSIDNSVQFRTLRDQQATLAAEVASLKQRKSNIPAAVLEIRAKLCAALGVAEDELPFAGELMQVLPAERPWEGAIERVLGGFGTSLLVPDEHSAAVARYVDATHLGTRLVYHRIKESKATRMPERPPNSLWRKLEFKHDAPLSEWVSLEVARRFNPTCCESLDEFRREKEALTRQGQHKVEGRHTKDDRSRVDDRTRFVLGWANHEKLAALEKQLATVERQAQDLGRTLTELQKQEEKLRGREKALEAVLHFRDFGGLDWRQSAAALHRLAEERAALERASDVLRALEARLKKVDVELRAVEEALRRAGDRLAELRQEQKTLERHRGNAQDTLSRVEPPVRSRFEDVARLRGEAGVNELPTLETVDAIERKVRKWLQERLERDGREQSRLSEAIVAAMQRYRNAFPLETREVDAHVAAAGEYRKMLATLRADDLPRFERKFKELLNENTLREVANFQAQLLSEREQIDQRIEIVNKSLRNIEFNRGSYIRLMTTPSLDVDVRDFRAALKACTTGTLGANADAAMTEARFLQVQELIKRFRGREGMTDLDERWTKKVTDVRTWFAFSASERRTEDDSEREHYTDSGGKSGGQKEKLAYTVLAASLAYQFGLEWGESRSRSFRFVTIDEAFGRGSDDSTAYGLELFRRLNLQLLVVTPLQKIHVIEPYVAHVGYVSNLDGRHSSLRNLTIEEFREERDRRAQT